MKKILSFVMAAMMVVMMLPALVGADEVAGVEVADEAALRVAVKEGVSIKLIDNITLTSYLFTLKDVEIDLNGYSIYTNASSAVCHYKGNAVIKDSSNNTENGIIGTNASYSVYIANYYEDAQKPSMTIEDAVISGYDFAVTVKDGVLTLKDGAKLVGLSTTSKCGDGIRAYDNSVVTIESGAVINASSVCGTALEVYDPNVEAEIEEDAVLTGAIGVVLYGGSLVTAGDIFGEESGIVVSKKNDSTDDSIIGAAELEVIGGNIAGKKYTALEVSEKATDADIKVSGGTFSAAPEAKYIADGKKFDEATKSVICIEHKNIVVTQGNVYHQSYCNDCDYVFYFAEHTWGEWERDGYKNVRYCTVCGDKVAPQVEALTAGQKAVDNIQNVMKTLATRKFAVAIDCDEDAVVITNNTNTKKIIDDLGDSALYNYLADVKYSFAAAEGYEIVSVTLDGAEVDADDVLIYQIKGNHVIKVVTEEIVVEEAAEEAAEAETAVAETVAE